MKMLTSETRRIGGVTALRPTNPASACFGSLSVVLSLASLATSGMLLQRYAGADTYTALMAVRPTLDAPSLLQTARF